jgi:surface protein
MDNMFAGTESFNQPLDKWDVSNVANMYGMFAGASVFNGDISSWDVSSVSDMNGMLSNASFFNQPLNDWDVSNVTSMEGMFYEATTFNQPLNEWDITSVAIMSNMFDNAGLSTDNYDGVLNSWSQQDVKENVTLGAVGLTYFSGEDARGNLIDNDGWEIIGDAKGFKPITDANFQEAINACLSTNSIDGMCTSSEYGAMPDWDVRQVTDMKNAFEERTDFNGDISSWDVSSVTNMSYMFYQASVFNQHLDWDTRKV